MRQEGGQLLWNDDANALCWVVLRDGKYVANVTTNSFDVSKLATGSVMTVRAANAMGGLGVSSAGVKLGAVSDVSRGIGANGIPSLAIHGRSIQVMKIHGSQALRLPVLQRNLLGRSCETNQDAPSFDGTAFQENRQ